MRNVGFYVMQESVAQQIRLLHSQRTSVFKGPLTPRREQSGLGCVPHTANTYVEQNALKPRSCCACPCKWPFKRHSAAREHVPLWTKTLLGELCLKSLECHIHSAAPLLGSYRATVTAPL